MMNLLQNPFIFAVSNKKKIGMILEVTTGEKQQNFLNIIKKEPP